MRKLIMATLLLFCSASYADDPVTTAPEGCTMTPPGVGQIVIQCGRYVTIKDKSKITVCNLGDPGTKPVCEEIIAQGSK